MNTDFYKKTAEEIRSADNGGLLMESDGLTGYSGKKLIGCLQRLAKAVVDKDHCYVEVGVFQGLTLLSVAGVVGKEAKVFGIDNFAFFDPENKNFGIVEKRRAHLGLNHAEVINMDYEDALENLREHIGDKKVSLYFVDGPHDYRSQLVCLLLIKPFLSEQAIIVVDDCNYQHVRQANCDFLKGHPEFKLIYESYTPCHPHNMTPNQKTLATKGWWNGVNIMVRDSGHQLAPMFPSTHRDRSAYEQEHILQSVRFRSSTSMGARFANAISQRKWKEILKVNYYFFRDYRKKNGLFPHMNTYSEDCPTNHFNSAV